MKLSQSLKLRIADGLWRSPQLEADSVLLIKIGSQGADGGRYLREIVEQILALTSEKCLKRRGGSEDVVVEVKAASFERMVRSTWTGGGAGGRFNGGLPEAQRMVDPSECLIPTVRRAASKCRYVR